MKYTLAVAVLVGLVAAEEPVWSLRSVQDHRTDSQVQKAYGDHSTKQADGRPPYQSAMQMSESDSESDSETEYEHLQVRGDDEEEDHSDEFFAPHESSKADDATYTRQVPARFSSDADDLFMRSMISTYALEGKNKDGSPNGAFVIDEAGARAASAEVLATHKGLTGAALKTYLDTYFPKAWKHFDVNQGGKVEVIKMPQFMRFLSSDQTLSLGE
mmetsp:Transcript_18506/g.31679  ORF Transcript_18506/g.31679 Transcript_18506/m.31679 type:complete len:215 (-) Transcript_18506:113-757(-)|eukprot:CAMPEP_0168611078 /NCGR_PEP_ID=MMETSP0449_2-20121227/2152_1 /TAXON_ID=1082188 /ORGANISM="Strombidium rassoulzadegani, Strain ras09" /LENGTH=214 /DNA_ID=CAMNT_0008651473 /DNA_START=578 /DNA_END=1222 /DNA_ORIENTATION=-